jgi:hypothetical protein
MAVPGEPSCVDIAPCGAAPWGEIPLGPSTQYVDGAYGGGDSDGSAAKPWVTVQQGIDAAVPGAVVAVAAGSYPGSVLITGKPVQLWGRCPSAVELAGGHEAAAALEIGPGADGTSVHRLALTGVRHGVVLSGARDLLLEGSWIHDTARSGVEMTDAHGTASLTLQRCVVEGAAMTGIMSAGAELTVEASTIRNIRAGGTQGYADGLLVVSGVVDAAPATTVVTNSVFEAVPGVGIRVTSGAATIEDSVVRDMLLSDQGQYGRGIAIEIPSVGTSRPSAIIRSSLVERTREIGLFAKAADVVVESTTIRDTRPTEVVPIGAGVWVRAGDDLQGRGNVTLRHSLIDQSRVAGVYATGSDAVLESTIVRGTVPDVELQYGRGVYAESDLATGSPSTLELRGCVVEHNHELSVHLLGSTGTIESSVLAWTASSGASAVGRGLGAEFDVDHGLRSSLMLRTSTLEDNQGVGLFVAGSDAIIEDVAVRRTMPDAGGSRGRGIAPQASLGARERAVVQIVRSIVEQSHESALYVFGADVIVDRSTMVDTAPRQTDGAFGDGITLIGTELLPASLQLTSCTVAENARAGIAAFGGHVTLSDNAVDCNPIALNAEESFVLQGETKTLPSGFEDLGGNRCGCGGQAEECLALSSGLEPPEPLVDP